MTYSPVTAGLGDDYERSICNVIPSRADGEGPHNLSQTTTELATHSLRREQQWYADAVIQTEILRIRSG